MVPITLFSWGYWGWGTSTEQLVHGVDAAERWRGFEPPVFVDIRISRSVRAPGFRDAAFEQVVGPSRYRWMSDLGNEGILDGGRLRIKNPAAAEVLLDIATELLATGHRRLIFFCACEFPGPPENLSCHRVEVASLLLAAAHRRRRPIDVTEWPGGDPKLDALDVRVSRKVFNSLLDKRRSIPLCKGFPLAEMACLPWCSVASVYPEDHAAEPLRLVTGPARYKKGEWYLPVLGDVSGSASPTNVAREIKALRDDWGSAPRKTGRR
jgi:hypothetical protein